MIVSFTSYHELREITAALKGRDHCEALQVGRELRPEAAKAFDRFEETWREKEIRPEFPSILTFWIRFLFDRRYNAARFKRIAKTKSGYNPDINRFTDDLSEKGVEKSADLIYARMIEQLESAVDYIRKENKIANL